MHAYERDITHKCVCLAHNACDLRSMANTHSFQCSHKPNSKYAVHMTNVCSSHDQCMQSTWPLYAVHMTSNTWLATLFTWPTYTAHTCTNTHRCVVGMVWLMKTVVCWGVRQTLVWTTGGSVGEEMFHVRSTARTYETAIAASTTPEIVGSWCNPGMDAVLFVVSAAST